MSEFYKTYGWSIYSQHGEDGILSECIKRINPIQISCEFGANDGIRHSNTYLLLTQGWHSTFIEENPEYKKDLLDNLSGMSSVIVIDKVTPENINEMVSQELGILSIDVDNDDYHLWAAYKGKADIVVIEINSGIIPPREEIPGKSGTSYTSVLKLAIKKGYFLVCHTGNMIFVLNKHRDKFPELKGDGHNWEEYWDKDLK